MLDEELQRTLLKLGVVTISDKNGTTYSVIRFTDLRRERNPDAGATRYGTGCAGQLNPFAGAVLAPKALQLLTAE